MELIEYSLLSGAFAFQVSLAIKNFFQILKYSSLEDKVRSNSFETPATLRAKFEQKEISHLELKDVFIIGIGKSDYPLKSQLNETSSPKLLKSLILKLSQTYTIQEKKYDNFTVINEKMVPFFELADKSAPKEKVRVFPNSKTEKFDCYEFICSKTIEETRHKSIWDLLFDVFLKLVGIGSIMMSEILRKTYYTVKFDIHVEEYGVKCDSKLIILGDVTFNQIKRMVEVSRPKVISNNLNSITEFLKIKRNKHVVAFGICSVLTFLTFKLLKEKFPKFRDSLMRLLRTKRLKSPIKDVVFTNVLYEDSVYKFKCLECNELKDTYCSHCGFMGYCTLHSNFYGVCPRCNVEFNEHPKVIIA